MWQGYLLTLPAEAGIGIDTGLLSFEPRAPTRRSFPSWHAAWWPVLVLNSTGHFVIIAPWS